MEQQGNSGTISQRYEFYDHIRRRPDMFIGSKGRYAPQILLQIMIEVALMSKDIQNLEVCLEADGSATVSDDGSNFQQDFLNDAATERLQDKILSPNFSRAMGKLGLNEYSFVAALSSAFEIYHFRGDHYRVSYPDFRLVCESSAPVPNDTTSKLFYFKPDDSIFQQPRFFPHLTEHLLRMKSYFFPRLRTNLLIRDQEGNINMQKLYHAPGGLRDMVNYISFTEKLILPPLELNFQVAEFEFTAAFSWHPNASTRIRSFVNSILTGKDGSHVNGFTKGLQEGLLQVWQNTDDLPIGTLRTSPVKVKNNLVAIVSLRTRGDYAPTFETPTMDKLGDDQVSKIIAPQVKTRFISLLMENREIRETLLLYLFSHDHPLFPY